MKNILNYYYNLYPLNIIYRENKYFFEYNNNKYVFEKIIKPISDIESLYKINIEMINNNMLFHEIILNKEKNILTYINGFYYILMEIHVNINIAINVQEICYINNNTYNIKCDDILDRHNWIMLWEEKNDYFETQINEIGHNYPNLCYYLNYYIGIAENAIMYIKNALKLNNPVTYSICHRRINSNDSLFYLYHPLYLIHDYRIRDISEYLKSLFFDNKDVYSVIIDYFSHNYISYEEALLLYGRLLYPSYFFDMYDEIVNNNLEEKKINSIINKSGDYEKFLINMNKFLSKLYGVLIPQLDWLIK